MDVRVTAGDRKGSGLMKGQRTLHWKQKRASNFLRGAELSMIVPGPIFLTICRSNFFMERPAH